VQSRKRKSLGQKIRYDFKKFMKTPKAVMRRSRRIFIEPIYGPESVPDSQSSNDQKYNNLTTVGEETMNEKLNEYEDQNMSDKLQIAPLATTSLSKMEIGISDREKEETISTEVFRHSKSSTANTQSVSEPSFQKK
jgi:hypothetical protein